MEQNVNKFVILNDVFTDTTIRNGSLSLAKSLTGDELKYDTLEIVIDRETKTAIMVTSEEEVFTTSLDEFIILPYNAIESEITDYVYGTPVYYEHNNKLFGKFYLDKVTRTGAYTYQLSCVSAIGLLTNAQHYGGIYNGQTFSEIVDEIIGDMFPYTIDSFLAKQPMYGWLPVATKRENLHQVLFAMSASVTKDENGDVVFNALSSDIVSKMDESRVYLGGKVQYPQVATKVSLAEHSYVERNTDEIVTLYDGEIAAENITTPLGNVVLGGLIIFDEPSHHLVVENSEIVESGVNYAVLSPSSDCLLTGQKYTHTVRQVTRPETDENNVKDIENKVVVDNATLISIINSENVADRLQSYYSSAKVVTMDIITEKEEVGDSIQFTDPFLEEEQGIISSMNIAMSGTLKASCEVVVGYKVPALGNYYKNVEVVSESKRWQVPDGVEKIRVVLIGGGQGGTSGENGENAEGGKLSAPASEGGHGGGGGKGGQGGKILIATVNVGENKFFDVEIGQGGAGGISDTDGKPNDGEFGEATIFGNLTSENGTVSTIGFTEIFNEEVYALDGEIGISGGDGGKGVDGQDIVYDGITYKGGKKGTYYRDGNSSDIQVISYSAGGGGGAAAGDNGNNADDRSNGGNGANATMPSKDAFVYGCGGQGGHGGGGGGGCGVIESSATVEGYDYLNWYRQGNGGKGGRGGQGGRGANGCAIIYY